MDWTLLSLSIGFEWHCSCWLGTVSFTINLIVLQPTNTRKCYSLPGCSRFEGGDFACMLSWRSYHWLFNWNSQWLWQFHCFSWGSCNPWCPRALKLSCTCQRRGKRWDTPRERGSHSSGLREATQCTTRHSWPNALFLLRGQMVAHYHGWATVPDVKGLQPAPIRRPAMRLEMAVFAWEHMMREQAAYHWMVTSCNASETRGSAVGAVTISTISARWGDQQHQHLQFFPDFSGISGYIEIRLVQLALGLD